jgi:hypothetical protein
MAHESVTMPKAYFEPENLNALIEVFTEAKRRLSRQDITDPPRLDFVALTACRPG